MKNSQQKKNRTREFINSTRARYANESTHTPPPPVAIPRARERLYPPCNMSARMYDSPCASVVGSACPPFSGEALAPNHDVHARAAVKRPKAGSHRAGVITAQMLKKGLQVGIPCALTALSVKKIHDADTKENQEMMKASKANRENLAKYLGEKLAEARPNRHEYINSVFAVNDLLRNSPLATPQYLSIRDSVEQYVADEASTEANALRDAHAREVATFTDCVRNWGYGSGENFMLCLSGIMLNTAGSIAANPTQASEFHITCFE